MKESEIAVNATLKECMEQKVGKERPAEELLISTTEQIGLMLLTTPWHAISLMLVSQRQVPLQRFCPLHRILREFSTCGFTPQALTVSAARSPKG